MNMQHAWEKNIENFLGENLQVRESSEELGLDGIYKKSFLKK